MPSHQRANQLSADGASWSQYRWPLDAVNLLCHSNTLTQSNVRMEVHSHAPPPPTCWSPEKSAVMCAADTIIWSMRSGVTQRDGDHFLLCSLRGQWNTRPAAQVRGNKEHNMLCVPLATVLPSWANMEDAASPTRLHGPIICRHRSSGKTGDGATPRALL